MKTFDDSVDKVFELVNSTDPDADRLWDGCYCRCTEILESKKLQSFLDRSAKSIALAKQDDFFELENMIKYFLHKSVEIGTAIGQEMERK